jgi:dTDP-4-amino-4,6-dideoxy-D-galactose acyltransferase
MKHELLSWDSDFFGFNVGAFRTKEESDADIESMITTAYSSGVELLYVFSKEPLKNEILLNKYNGLLVDKKVIFTKALHQETSTYIDEITEYTENFVADELKELAFQSGDYSRFKVDTRLPADTFNRLYTIWIENSVNGKFASKIFIYKVGGSIAGFITVTLKENYGDIGLIAVNSNFRGMEIGTKLIQHTEGFVNKQGKKILKVATQIDNERACNFYKKNGYEIDSISNIYHFLNQKS